MLLQKPKTLKEKQKQKQKEKEKISLSVNVDDFTAKLLKGIDTDIEKVEPELVMPLNKKIEEEEKKLLSPLKKVEGVLNYYQEIKKDKEKNSLPKYLNDLTINTLYSNNCQNFINDCYIRLPIIIISQNF